MRACVPFRPPRRRNDQRHDQRRRDHLHDQPRVLCRGQRLAHRWRTARRRLLADTRRPHRRSCHRPSNRQSEIVYNLAVEGLHNGHVQTGDGKPVLVHNNGCETTSTDSDLFAFGVVGKRHGQRHILENRGSSHGEAELAAVVEIARGSGASARIVPILRGMGRVRRLALVPRSGIGVLFAWPTRFRRHRTGSGSQ